MREGQEKGENSICVGPRKGTRSGVPVEPWMSHLNPVGCIMLPAVWTRLQEPAQATEGWPRPSSLMVREAILLTVCSKGAVEVAEGRRLTQPKGTEISQRGQENLAIVF